MKLAADSDALVKYADKVLVKDHVCQVLGRSYVIPTLWSGSKLPPRSERNWPVPFIVKANHGSAMNILVRSVGDLDWDEIERQTEAWLERDWPAHLCEEWYNKINRQILIEPVIGDTEHELADYKFFVFSGRAVIIQVDTNRYTNHRQTFYDRTWQKINIGIHYPQCPDFEPPPAHLAEMIDAAEKIGSGFAFSRVDFYDLPEGPKFGEITFAPHAGFGRFRPSVYDHIFGKIWEDALTDAAKGAGRSERYRILLHEFK